MKIYQVNINNISCKKVNINIINYLTDYYDSKSQKNLKVSFVFIYKNFTIDTFGVRIL